MKLLRSLLLLLACCLPLLAPAQDEATPVQATDLYRIQQLGDVALSPDGREVIYTVRQVVEADEGERTYRPQLWLLSTRPGAEPRQLTRAEEGASQPVWHPEGDRIAFARAVDGTSQIFLLPLQGGEAVQLTDVEFGASSPAFSPEGDRILFSQSMPGTALRESMGTEPAWPDERPRRSPADTAGAEAGPDGSLAEVRAWLAKQAAEDAPRVINRLDLQGERDLEPRQRFTHIFVQPLREGAEAVRVTDGYYDHGGAAWLDGERILFHAARDAEQHPDRVRDSDLFVVRSDGSELQRVLDLPGYAVYGPVPSPDQQHVAFTATALADSGYAQRELGVFVPGDGSDPELLTTEFDRSVGGPAWSPDGWNLYVTAASEGAFPLYRLSPFGQRPGAEQPADSLAPSWSDSAAVEAPTPEGPVRLTGMAEGVRSFDVSDAALFYVLTRPSNPYELFTASFDGTRQRRMTSHNASWLADRLLSVPEPHALVREDSLRVDYWMMKPVGFEEGERYPHLVEIHGGPMAMWGPGEATMWHEFQFFAGKGYAITFANPRGSGGYGIDFKRANYRDWGSGPAGDVLAAASEAASRAWVDTTRQVVTGGSYAGYLTAWIVGHDDRFRAAVAQRGVYDLTTFLGEGNAWRLVPYHFGGYPWSASSDSALSVREVLLRESPLTYVDRIRTPLLIMHADEDLRTGVIQSEMLYKSLKILGRPVEYVRYPKSGHDLSRTGDPELRLDRILRIYEFFERFIGPEAMRQTAIEQVPALVPGRRATQAGPAQ